MNDKLEQIADVLVTESFKLKKGELLVITSDYGESNLALCDCVYNKARAAGAEAMIIRTAPAESHGKLADKIIPYEPFVQMMMYADCWLDTGTMGWLYSNAFEAVITKNRRMRYYLISSIAIDQLYEMIVLPEELHSLAYALRDILCRTTTVRITAANGTDAQIGITPEYPIQADLGKADQPCFAAPPALVNIIPRDNALNGRIVVNCVYADPWGITENITLICRDGEIVEVTAKNPADAARMNAWLARWEDPAIYRTAHMNFGLLPGVREFLNTGALNDGIVNERMWGCMNWGFGSVSKNDKPPHGQPSKSHFDCITPTVSAWVDGVMIMENGEFVYGILKKYADAIKRRRASG